MQVFFKRVFIFLFENKQRYSHCPTDIILLYCLLVSIIIGG